MSRLFRVIHHRGCEQVRGKTATHALNNVSVPGGAKAVLAIFAEELLVEPQRSRGACTALIGNLVTEGGAKA